MRHLLCALLVLAASVSDAETRNYTRQGGTLSEVNASQLAANLDSALSVTGVIVTLNITPTLIVVDHPSLTVAFDATVNSTLNAYILDPLYNQRGPARLLIASSTDALSLELRAGTDLLVDELNAVRQWNMGLQAAVAAATSFADLKVRIAALPALPNRTLVQAANAIQAKIQAGSAD